ncbi:MAG: DNA internalization-related competence protein ComEC/Rec2 [Desulfovibrio sp.]|nr:DNA internalization-related competence protein ComEC/Rec2 [Desulfovibrio sp.]
MRHPPLRPPLLWQSCLLALISGLLSAAWPAACLAGAAFVFFFDRRLWTPARATLFCLAFAAGFLVAWSRFSQTRDLDAISPAWLENQLEDGYITGDITSVRGMPGKRLRILLENVRYNNLEPLPGLCVWTWESPPRGERPLPGQSVRIARKVSRFRAFANSDGEEIYPMFAAREIYWRMASFGDKGDPRLSGKADYFAKAREKILNGFIKILRRGEKKNSLSQAKALLIALIFGDRFYINLKTRDNFASASLAHSLALSGQHLCAAALIGLLCVLGLARAKPGIFLKWPRARLAGLATIPFALAYLWLGDAPASLLRAVCMLAVLVYFSARRLPWTGTDILATALAAILLYDPLSIYDAGLQLSVICLVILTISAPLFNRAFGDSRLARSAPGKIALRAAQILAVSLLIQLFILPVSLNYFHLAGWLFFLNLLWLPLLAIMVLPFAVLGLIFSLLPIFATLSSAALWLAALPCRFILNVLNFLAARGLFDEPAFIEPPWTVFLAFAGLLAAICWLAGHKNRKPPEKSFICALLPLLLFPPCERFLKSLNGNLVIEALDVGQGQAILIKTRGTRLLIDGGGTPPDRFDMGRNVIRPVLTNNARPVINALINTHPDIDHLGGFFHPLKTFAIGQLFHNGHEPDKRFAPLWRDLRVKNAGGILREGDVIEFGDPLDDLRLEVLHPPKDGNFKGNEASLVTRLTRKGETLAIFPGDAGPRALRRVAAHYPDLKTRVFATPHHGSDKNFEINFFNSAAPELGLVSCGYNNRWDFPGPKVKAWFAERGIPLFATSNLGRITVTLKKDGDLSVSAALEKNQTSFAK